jgi:two-component system, OmpR family, phosphate regulon response regulator OmpR
VQESKHVLIIDDDQRLSGMLADYLQRQSFDVAQAATAKEGLALLSQRRPDALILDLMLPDADGLTVCAGLRARSDDRWSIPIIMLTAKGDALDRVVGLEMGADDYLPKPFEPRELLARLKALLRRPPLEGLRNASTSTLRFGRLELDLNAREVRVAGVRRSLTAYQFELLTILAERAGRVLTRDQLMNLMHGRGQESFDRSIDVHIARIRAVIEDDPRDPRRIQTIRGSGYIFVKLQP